MGTSPSPSPSSTAIYANGLVAIGLWASAFGASRVAAVAFGTYLAPALYNGLAGILGIVYYSVSDESYHHHLRR